MFASLRICHVLPMRKCMLMYPCTVDFETQNSHTNIVSVRIRVKEGMDTYYEGIFIQARSGTVDTVAHGTFNESDDKLKTLSCFNQADVRYQL